MSGFYFEEIQKVWTIGTLANRLLLQLDYQDTVVLDFVHTYGRKTRPEYFVSVGDGGIESRDQFQWVGQLPLVTRPIAIVIRQRSSEFDITGELRLLQYAVQNFSSLKSQQHSTTYQMGLERLSVESIDTSQTRRIASSPSSELVKRTLQTRVYRPDDMKWEKEGGISYYWQDGSYFFQYRSFDYQFEDDTVSGVEAVDGTLLTRKSLYQFVYPIGSGALVFDTDSTFYYVSYPYMRPISRKHKILARKSSLEPFSVSRVGFDKIAITYECNNRNKSPFGYRTMLYRVPKDLLIQDLDLLLDNKQ